MTKNEETAGQNAKAPGSEHGAPVPVPPPAGKKRKRRFFLYALVSLVGLGALGMCATAAMIYWASRDLPPYTRIADYRLPVVTSVYARDNSVLGYLYDEKRFLTSLEDMPEHLRRAFVAAEDGEFYNHIGINPMAIGRAALNNIRSGKITGGGSTITQQIVKRLLVGGEKSYIRKIREAILAIQVEKYLSKNEILTIYLNEIYLGSGAHGVEAAARTYFAKHTKDLTLAEAAVLATLPQAPSTNNPYANPIATKGRQRYVLEQMLRHGWITQAEFDEAYAQPLVYAAMEDPSWKLGAWYLEEVRRELLQMFSEANVREKNIPIEMYGKDAVYMAGLHVYTAMDPVHQAAGEKSLRASLLETAKRQGWHGPIETVEADKVTAYLEKHPFDPAELDNAGWAKALVTEVKTDGAQVRLGAYSGFISVATMSWARTPNIKQAPDGVNMRDATKILNVGDVVWVSAVGAKGDANPVGAPFKEPDAKGKGGVPAYDPAAVKKDAPIPLCLEELPVAEGAFVSMETATGDVVALVGGYEYSQRNQYNRATQARRQPGSSFKPIVYSAALDHGFTAGSMLLDSPYVTAPDPTMKTWRPGNYDGTFMGPMILRTALAKSRNLCTVQIAQRMGMEPIVEHAKTMGVEGDIPPELAVSLGAHEVTPLNMVSVYSAFADGGKRSVPRLITRVTDTWGQDLVVMEPQKIQTLSEQNAFIMATLLKEVVNAGTAYKARALGIPLGGKTGTSNEERDTWFMGFSPHLVTGVYTGYDKVQSLGRLETGGRTALPAFIYYHRIIDHLYPPDDFVQPSGIVWASVDAKTGKLAGKNSDQSFYLPFMQGTAPSVRSDQSSVVESGEDLLRQIN
ncbi:Penicillin-binding, 1A family protein [uncultured delta proteobacterium]|uniref:Penicillin-binding protein 1A n=1 Tax=uncultured delta proteobacterium TaxID=34034 RepID=A0A212KEQ3_9DELT|nr:Penicillin-binding, 1A family protein [uncultured delta proteobacterium]